MYHLRSGPPCGGHASGVPSSSEKAHAPASVNAGFSNAGLVRLGACGFSDLIRGISIIHTILLGSYIIAVNEVRESFHRAMAQGRGRLSYNVPAQWVSRHHGSVFSEISARSLGETTPLVGNRDGEVN